MRFIKTFLLMVLASAFLVACGGGGGDTPGNTSTDGNLVAAYDKVTAGMTYEQVKAIVGYAHNGGQQEFSSSTTYKWQNAGPTTILAVSISSTGARNKIITSPNGTSSKTF